MESSTLPFSEQEVADRLWLLLLNRFLSHLSMERWSVGDKSNPPYPPCVMLIPSVANIPSIVVDPQLWVGGPSPYRSIITSRIPLVSKYLFTFPFLSLRLLLKSPSVITSPRIIFFR